jgi:hypothetical protein
MNPNHDSKGRFAKGGSGAKNRTLAAGGKRRPKLAKNTRSQPKGARLRRKLGAHARDVTVRTGARSRPIAKVKSFKRGLGRTASVVRVRGGFKARSTVSEITYSRMGRMKSFKRLR